MHMNTKIFVMNDVKSYNTIKFIICVSFCKGLIASVDVYFFKKTLYSANIYNIQRYIILNSVIIIVFYSFFCYVCNVLLCKLCAFAMK